MLLLKNEFTPEWEFSHCLHVLMLMESPVKFCNPQDISWASQQRSIAAFS